MTADDDIKKAQEAVTYSSSYFEEAVFDTDYQKIAECILHLYSPKRVIDVGCGPGKLSQRFAEAGIEVTAVDGFASPAFTHANISFTRVDLNSRDALMRLEQMGPFDLAVCLEVAEHLAPSVSSTLISVLTKLAPVVVFSAAVPEQGGHGHINLKSRELWHQEFVNNRFHCADRVRVLLRGEATVAAWYRLNIVDYVRSGHPLTPQVGNVVARLIASESYAASRGYKMGEELNAARNRLQSFPVKQLLSVRRLARHLFRGGKHG
jgi:SAM-dependent methyltransferase